MKNTQKATSVIEAMVIMLIIVTGVVGMYNIYTESVRLSSVTAQRLQAIQIAREGVEAMENIRNTNWSLYAADYKNCWNTINYDSDCRGDDSDTTDIAASRYIIFQDDTDLRWKIEPINVDTNTKILKDNTGFYTQTGSFEETRFSREIEISYLDDSTMRVLSQVTWNSIGDRSHNIEIESILTNWKNED